MSYQIVSLPGARFTGLLALSAEQLAASYRMRFASYIRKSGDACGQADEMPEPLRTRVLAVRSFDKDAMLVADELVEGRDIEVTIERQLADPRAAYLHIYYAMAGRYAARVERH